MTHGLMWIRETYCIPCDACTTSLQVPHLTLILRKTSISKRSVCSISQVQLWGGGGVDGWGLGGGGARVDSIGWCSINFYPSLTLCIPETPKQVFWQTVKTQMKYSIMLHFIRVTLFVKVKKKTFR